MRPWAGLAIHAKPGVGRTQLIALYQSVEPQAKQGTVISGVSQFWRFVNDIQDGDWVVTYSPANRLYSIGKVTGPAEAHTEWDEQGMPLVRKAEQDLQRDDLGTHTKIRCRDQTSCSFKAAVLACLMLYT